MQHTIKPRRKDHTSRVTHQPKAHTMANPNCNELLGYIQAYINYRLASSSEGLYPPPRPSTMANPNCNELLGYIQAYINYRLASSSEGLYPPPRPSTPSPGGAHAVLGPPGAARASRQRFTRKPWRAEAFIISILEGKRGIGKKTGLSCSSSPACERRL